jgi:hypothetical protein
MNNPADRLIEHVLATLPDGLADRRNVLEALVKVTCLSTSDLLPVARRALSDLDRHIITLRELQPDLPELASVRGSSRLSDRPMARTRVVGTPSVSANQLKPGHEYVMHWAGYSQRVRVYNGQGGALYFRTHRSEHPVATVPDADWYPVAPKGGAR